MVVSTKVLDALKSIGLNLYERKIFVALLAKGIATAGEVSGIAKVPRSRSYDILESLADKGFVILQPSKPIKYVALEPSDALERVKHNLDIKHDEMVERINRLGSSDILKDLNNLFKRGFSLMQPFEMTGTIKGKHAINQQLKSLFKQAKDNITIMTTQNGLDELHSAHYNILKKATKKGVALNIFAPDPAKASEKLRGIAEMKSVSAPKGRVYTIDNEQVVLALTDDNEVHSTQDVVFWANSPHIVKDVIHPMFDRVKGA